MFRIRFHGRGGDGMKTASRILGTSFFLEGFQVQDAPRYGAERRGAPVFAYVRADHKQIYERGEIHRPDLVVIADETLLHIAPHTVLEGVRENTVLLIITGMDRSELEKYINCGKSVITIDPSELQVNYRQFLSSITASASAKLTGKIKFSSIIRSIEEELILLKGDAVRENSFIAERIYQKMEPYAGVVAETAEEPVVSEAHLIALHIDDTSAATPAIRLGATSIKNITGSWRRCRPVVDYDKCTGCMLCNVYCPDSVIQKNETGFPVIDYDHCKGCLICAEICPAGAIKKEDEKKFRGTPL